jgi:L-asparaginase II
MAMMYNTAGYDPGAFLTNLKNTALQKYNQQMGASGGAADIAIETKSKPNYAVRAQELARPYSGMAKQYGFGDDPSKIQGTRFRCKTHSWCCFRRDEIINNIAAKTGL